MNRRRILLSTSVFRPDLARIAWCMVGTAEYQVGARSSNHLKKRKALKPGLAINVPPVLKVARTQAMSPWM